MSEKIYSWLLRLYPSHFRERYGDAALQLFRDRSRHEQGFFLGLRLWFDILADLAISVPRQHRYSPPALMGAGAGPAFSVLEGGSPRPGALLLGGLLSLSFVFGSVLIGPLEQHRPGRNSTAGSRFLVATEQASVERQRVIQESIANLKQYYKDPAVAQKVADTLLAHQKAGDYDSVTDAAFADLLTKQIREVSQDRHLIVVYRDAATSSRRVVLVQPNCAFEKVEMLPHNIGYLKLNWFPDASICRPAANAAMASFNQADAIIFDLRDNVGGFPDMVALLAAYLFDHPEYLYNPREITTERSWTRSPVPGNRLADKPVYVLTSSKTLSGAEQFTYDLKMLKRATIVGETTGGSAHAGVYHRIDDHFGIGIPEARAINPFSKYDWEGTGVEPDVKVPAADALERAKKLADRH